MIRTGLAMIAAVSLTGCLNLVDRCGEATPTGACLSVIGVVPVSNAQPTSNVDVLQGTCSDGNMPPKVTAEPFRDHDVQFTLRNEGPISVHDPAEYSPAVVVKRFEVSFQLNTPCNGCPVPDSLRGLGPTVTVLGGTEATFTLPLMPIRTKDEFLAKGGDAQEFPLYSALYKIHVGDPEGDIVVEGATTFTVGNFEGCPQ